MQPTATRPTTPTTEPKPATRQSGPVPLAAQDLLQVSGGLPRIGGLCIDPTLTQQQTSLPRIGGI